ncbi:helix-turn-helix domain-containing protein [Streptomyces sp. SP18CS02]|uniref:helix-turn-helix domain-containing protein n=1 Tax=Streptomyces sp. SP18CS02 TaxID=3002531 RepID=UPI002E788937|nr:helix-turn-helix domain-containing protein [Streptomyces sp. SP18CS02]
MRHDSQYTVVGNHLAQHRELSLVAIGLAVHIQSLRPGAKIGIKCFANRFPESEQRIAAAMLELEEAGYLERFRERLPNGRIVPRAISYNRPGACADQRVRLEPAAPESFEPPEPEKPPVREQPPPPPQPEPADTPEPAPAPVPAPVSAPASPLPEPTVQDPERHRAATALLAGLRRDEPRLLLAEADVRRLAPGVAAWLERGAAPDAVRRTLTASLPDELRRPAGLLAYRLTAMLPPPLPAVPGPKDPFQTCEDCERAFRAPGPGRCRDCRPA